MAIIKDGNTGFTAGVNSRNQLNVHAITFDGAVDAADDGRAWNLNTGYFTITGDSSLMYIKNTSEQDFFIERIVVAIGDGITFTGFPYFDFLKNPTGGDIITDEDPILINQNRNFGLTDNFGGDVYKGKTGGTATGDTGTVATIQIGKGGSAIIPVNYVLPKQASGAVMLTLNGTGTAQAYCAIVGYFHDHT